MAGADLQDWKIMHSKTVEVGGKNIKTLKVMKIREYL